MSAEQGTAVHAWVLPSSLEAIPAAVTQAVDACRAAGVDARHCGFHLPLALTEALSNAVRCGRAEQSHPELRVCVEITPAQVVLEVEDDGPGFDWEACARSPDAADWLERDGGRGLFLLRSYMDLVESVPPTAVTRHRVRMLLRRT